MPRDQTPNVNIQSKRNKQKYIDKEIRPFPYGRHVPKLPMQDAELQIKKHKFCSMYPVKDIINEYSMALDRFPYHLVLRYRVRIESVPKHASVGRPCGPTASRYAQCRIGVG